MAEEQAEEKEKNEGSEGDAVSSLPNTKDLTLEEARRRYNDEENRRTGVESKIGTIITVDALIISISGIFPDFSIFLLISMFLALISVGIGLWALRTRNYNRPGKPIDDLLQYEDMAIETQRKQLLFDYILAIDGNEGAENPKNREIGNRTKNDTKYRYCDICVLLTGLSLVFILVEPTIELLNSFNVL